jgi:RNA polymerase sigma-70 factor (ECF subfamily)
MELRPIQIPDYEVFNKFDFAVLRHLPSALKLARWFVRNDDDAKDVVQEAMLRAFKSFGTFRGGGGRAWLFAIIRNLAIRVIARKHKEKTTFDEEIHFAWNSLYNPEVTFFRQVDHQLVRQAIEGLPAQLRDVLILRELEGLSYNEIADVTRLPLGTVMSCLFRAREQLRQSLAPNTVKALNRAADGRNAAAESAM